MSQNPSAPAVLEHDGGVSTGGKSREPAQCRRGEPMRLRNEDMADALAQRVLDNFDADEGDVDQGAYDLALKQIENVVDAAYHRTAVPYVLRSLNDRTARRVSQEMQ